MINGQDGHLNRGKFGKNLLLSNPEIGIARMAHVNCRAQSQRHKVPREATLAVLLTMRCGIEAVSDPRM